jgi:ABC-type siderophore export system fused ATPase/permease subunit
MNKMIFDNHISEVSNFSRKECPHYACTIFLNFINKNTICVPSIANWYSLSVDGVHISIHLLIVTIITHYVTVRKSIGHLTNLREYRKGCEIFADIIQIPTA